jgi:hypothetical protein
MKDFPPGGFAGLSRRVNCLKPVIAAVNGFAFGKINLIFNILLHKYYFIRSKLQS